MVVLATTPPGTSAAAELPIDDAPDNQKYQGGRMILLWQKRAMVNVVTVHCGKAVPFCVAGVAEDVRGQLRARLSDGLAGAGRRPPATGPNPQAVIFRDRRRPDPVRAIAPEPAESHRWSASSAFRGCVRRAPRCGRYPGCARCYGNRAPARRRFA